jgi:hypothetical protein
MTFALPASFSRINGTYEVTAAYPGVWATDIEGGVALRVPVELTQTAEDHYAWDPEADEVDLREADEFDPLPPIVPAPLEIVATTGESAALAGVPRIRFAFLPEDGADYYEYRAWITGESEGGLSLLTGEDLDGDGRVFAFIGAIPGREYNISVRSVRERGAGRGYHAAVSDWTSTTVTALPPDLDLDAPEIGSATGGDGEIVAQFQAPNSADFKGLEIWGSDTPDLADAGLLDGPFYGAANATYELTETGLGPEQTRWYFARSLGPYHLRLRQGGERLQLAGRAHRSQLGEVVQDDPQGFVLPDAMIDLFAQRDEIFWRMP